MMMKRSLALVGLLGCSLLIPRDSRSQDARQFVRPTFLPGKTYRFLSNTNIYMAPSGEPERQIIMEQQARYDADARPDRGKGVALRGLTERLKVQIQSGGKEVAYDSLEKKDQKSVIGRHFESTVNRYVKLELDGKMRITSHQEAGRSGAATPLPELPRFGPEELVQLISGLPQGYSPDPVKMGDEWVLKGKRPVGELGQLGFEISYRHLGLIEHEGHACIAIDFRGQITGDIGENNQNIDFQGSRIFGRILFDTAEKMTRYSEHNVSMNVHIRGKNGVGDRSVPMTQKVVLQLMQIVKKE